MPYKSAASCLRELSNCFCPRLKNWRKTGASLNSSLENTQLKNKNVFIETTVWEDFPDQVSATGLQERYNEEVIQWYFVMLFFKSRPAHLEEFTAAHNQLKKTSPTPLLTLKMLLLIQTG
jgi:hypothetical protein